jgi:hypothetical protein
MVPPSNFSSKTNVQPRHPTGVGVHARHLSSWHTSALTWLPFFFYYFNDFLYIYIYINLGWLSHPQGTISDTYSKHREHIMKFIKPQGYIWEKKLCLSNKHLVILWVISIGYAYNFVFPISVFFFFFFFFFLKGSILVNMLF